MKNIFKKNPPLLWSSEAEDLLGRVPRFVAKMARTMAEKEARKRGLNSVEKDLLMELAQKFSPHQNSSNDDNDLLAKPSKNPLYDSFSPLTLNNNHSAKLGETLPSETYQNIWNSLKTTSRNRENNALYIHIPFCSTHCKYCGFFTDGSVTGAMERYTDYLIREMELICNHKAMHEREITSVYLGGGTPTDLPAKSLERVLKSLANFNLSADCEITLEGRVSSLSDEKIGICNENLVNRYSLGVQSFDTEIRQSLGRLSTRETLLERLHVLRKATDAVIVVDQIYGLPSQTMEIWENEIKTVFYESKVSGCDHYQLIRIAETPMDLAIKSGRMPETLSPQICADMYCKSLELLGEYGAKRISLRHYAFDEKERNRYNIHQAYNLNCIPIGCGAGGRLDDYFFYQSGKLEHYYSRIERGEKPVSWISPVMKGGDLFNRLSGDVLIKMQFSLDEIQQQCQWDNFELKSHLRPLLEQYESCKLVTQIGDGVWQLTTAGQFWNNAILQNLNSLIKRGL